MYPLESVIKKGRYYWHFMPYNLLLRMKTRKDIITGSNQIFYPQIMFKYNYRKYVLNLILGHSEHKTIGSVLDVNHNLWEVGLLLNRRFFHNRLYIFDAGIEIGGIWLSQEPSRKNEDTINSLGYHSLPTYKSFIYQVGFQKNNTFLFQYGFLLNIQFGITSYIYREQTEIKLKFGFPVSVGFGKRF